jgi:hypothetical protein
VTTGDSSMAVMIFKRVGWDECNESQLSGLFIAGIRFRLILAYGLTLKTPYRDGTTHIVMSPLEFMQRLAALVPRPRLHLIRFHGVLAPNARLRAEIIPSGPVTANATADDHGHAPPHSAPTRMWLKPGGSNGCSLSILNNVPSAATP